MSTKKPFILSVRVTNFDILESSYETESLIRHVKNVCVEAQAVDACLVSHNLVNTLSKTFSLSAELLTLACAQEPAQDGLSTFCGILFKASLNTKQDSILTFYEEASMTSEAIEIFHEHFKI